MPLTFQPVPGIELPIYRRDGPQFAIFYAPGCLCVVERGEAEHFEAVLTAHKWASTAIANVPSYHPEPSRLSSLQPECEDLAGQLRHCAAQAVREAERQRSDDFQPECLTLYLNNECNLGCTYCYASPSHGVDPRLDLDTIAAAANVVAASCRRKGRPFYAVFHGGGEPTLNREHLEATLALVEAVARTHDLEILRYVATNGLLSEEKAGWLAGRFDLIGLSCDGPPDIHDRQRPHTDGRGSSETVARTAHILRQAGVPIHVRATITRHSLHRQAEMAAYICSQLAPKEIHFEPVYHGGQTGTADVLSPDQAGDYVTHFLAAQRVARDLGIPLLGTGSRPADIHGPFCHVFRSVLNLVPGGLATACFKLSRTEAVQEKGAAIGAMNPSTARFEMDRRRIQGLRRQLGEPPAVCRTCFNRHHCARDCPDSCPLDDGSPGVAPEAGFRCRVQKATTMAILEEAAWRLWAEVEASGGRGPHGTRDLGPVTA